MTSVPVGASKSHYVCISKIGLKIVSRLVMEAFRGPCPHGLEVCHNNGDPSDNRLVNLRYDTRSSNSRDRFYHGTRKTNPSIVADIFKRFHADESPSLIAKMHSITADRVKGIVRKGMRNYGFPPVDHAEYCKWVLRHTKKPVRGVATLTAIHHLWAEMGGKVAILDVASRMGKDLGQISRDITLLESQGKLKKKSQEGRKYVMPCSQV